MLICCQGPLGLAYALRASFSDCLHYLFSGTELPRDSSLDHDHPRKWQGQTWRFVESGGIKRFGAAINVNGSGSFFYS